MVDKYIRKQDAIDAVEQANGNITWADRDNCKKQLEGLPPADVTHVIRCRKCKYFWAYRCMDSMPIEMCELGQTFYDPDRDFCSLAESREG